MEKNNFWPLFFSDVSLDSDSHDNLEKKSRRNFISNVENGLDFRLSNFRTSGSKMQNSFFE